ncbi:hypothetical protein [Sphingopyxis granuli]|uniref:hypothetical protein n=1 Tax=Sphingopyxis granuli TaxID=267128 RepID=UPI001BAFC0C8|nr:hypothetical protein [Sphingopyxis granuli]QUM73042.1 hypothetical protein ICN83_03790 [Sphingopyxis granuli]
MSDISNEMAAQAPPGGFAGAEYNDVALKAELEGIMLLNSRFEVAPDLLGRRKEWKLSYGRSISSCRYSNEENSVAGVFEYHVTAKIGRKRALHCVAEYVVFYETPVGATEAGAIGFCRNVGIFAAYPYFRALVARVTADANVQLPPLPMIASKAHIPPKKKKEQ